MLYYTVLRALLLLPLSFMHVRLALLRKKVSEILKRDVTMDQVEGLVVAQNSRYNKEAFFMDTGKPHCRASVGFGEGSLIETTWSSDQEEQSCWLD